MQGGGGKLELHIRLEQVLAAVRLNLQQKRLDPHAAQVGDWLLDERMIGKRLRVEVTIGCQEKPAGTLDFIDRVEQRDAVQPHVGGAGGIEIACRRVSPTEVDVQVARLPLEVIEDVADWGVVKVHRDPRRRRQRRTARGQ